MKVKVDSCQMFASSIKQLSGGKMALRKKTALKIAPDPVTSEGVTVGKTHQGNNGVRLGLACTPSHFRNCRRQIQGAPLFVLQ